MNGTSGFEGTPPDAEVPAMDLETAIQVLEHFGITPEDVAVVVVALETVLNSGGEPPIGGENSQPMPPAPVAPRSSPTAAPASPVPATAARPVPAPRPSMAPPAEQMPPRQAAPRSPTGNPLVDLAQAPPQPMQPLPIDQRRRGKSIY